MKTGKRGAFTLVEMLVVIALIGVLAGLVAFAVTKVIGSQSGSNTQTTIRTVQKVLNEHYAYVVAEARKETGLDEAIATMNRVFGPDSTGGERNRIIWVKMRVMEAFPTSYQEILWPPRPGHTTDGPFPYRTNIIPDHMRKYNGSYNATLHHRAFDNTQDAKGKPAHLTESSACLLLALSVMRNGTSLNLDNLGSSNVADTDGDGIQELIDGWGNALTFFRFPTDNQALQNSNPAILSKQASNALNADPLDPSGALSQLKLSFGRNVFEANVHKLVSPFNANSACYIVPTIVSSGPDGVLGLDNNMKIVPPPSFADDNIYSFQLR